MSGAASSCWSAAHHRPRAPHEARSGDEPNEVAVEGSLAVLAVGGGGYLPGIAPILVVDAIRRSVRVASSAGQPPLEGLERGFALADEIVEQVSASSSAYRGLHAWGAAAVLQGRELFLGHVADARAYRVRHGTIEQLTVDQMLPPPHGRVRAQVLGHRNVISPSIRRVAVAPGDVILLCSAQSAAAIEEGLVRMISSSTRETLDDLAEALARRAGAAVCLARVDEA